MSQVLLIDSDPGTLVDFGTVLRKAGYLVSRASSGSKGLEILARRPIDIAVTDLRLSDMSGLDILRAIRGARSVVPVIVVTASGSTKDAVAAMRLGAADFVEKPIRNADVLRIVERVLTVKDDGNQLFEVADSSNDPEAHAAARWARAIVPIMGSPRDPRTIAGWGRWVAASPGALRNWCRTAGITARRSLVFARMLRAASLSEGGRHRPENLLDVVDRRTLTGLLKFAGFKDDDDFPKDIQEFLARQALVRDPDALFEVKRALEERVPSRKQSPASQRESTAILAR